MSPLVKALDRLNRKERFWLLSDAVGQEIGDKVTQRIALNPGFTDKLQKELRRRKSKSYNSRRCVVGVRLSPGLAVRRLGIRPRIPIGLQTTTERDYRPWG